MDYYAIIRIPLGLIDFTTDLIHGIQLLLHGHPFWGTLTCLFPVASIIASLLYVGIGRCQRGDPMSCKKFICLSYTIFNRFFEAFIESAPEIVLQCVAVWRGVNPLKYVTSLPTRGLGSNTALSYFSDTWISWVTWPYSRCSPTYSAF